MKTRVVSAYGNARVVTIGVTPVVTCYLVFPGEDVDLDLRARDAVREVVRLLPRLVLHHVVARLLRPDGENVITLQDRGLLQVYVVVRFGSAGYVLMFILIRVMQSNPHETISKVFKTRYMSA